MQLFDLTQFRILVHNNDEENIFYFSALVPGNSGSVIYVVDAKEDLLFPLGILTGASKLKPKCNTTVYQAALLAPNLASIAEKDKLFVSDLKSLSKFCDHDQTIQRQLRAVAAKKRQIPKSTSSTTRPPEHLMLPIQPVSSPRTSKRLTGSAEQEETASFPQDTSCLSESNTTDDSGLPDSFSSNSLSDKTS